MVCQFGGLQCLFRLLVGFYHSDLGLRQISFEPLGTWHFGWLTTTPGRAWEKNWRWEPSRCVGGRGR